MPCPNVQIHDNDLGSRTPVERGAPLTLYATKDNFGTVPGKVVLVDKSDSNNKYTLQPHQFLWVTTGSTSFVTLNPVPVDLQPAKGTGDEIWLVQITLDGATSPCRDIGILVKRQVLTPSCPQAQVNDGTLGGPAKPQGPGDVVSLVATQGSFGGGTGTAEFSSPSTVGGQSLPGAPVAAQVVLWQSNLVQVRIPALPPFAQDAKWQLRVKPSGSTTACGPWDVHVKPQFQVPGTITIVPSTPLPRGGTVTVLATQGTFGPLGSASGTVTLRRTGTNPVEHAVPTSTWAPGAVVFTIPADLPAPQTDGVADEPWQVVLTPSGAQSWGSVGTIRVLAPVPAVVGIPPVAVAERVLNIVVTGATAGSTVRFYANGTEIAVREGLSPVPALPLPAPLAHLNGFAAILRCTAPTVAEAQAAPSYIGNRLRTTVEVEVEVGGKRSARQTTSLVLPPPAAALARRSGDTVTIGGTAHAGNADLNEIGAAKWLGNKTNGSVYVYQDGVAAADPAGAIARGLVTLAGDYAVPNREGASTAAVADFESVQKAPYPAVKAEIVEWTADKVVCKLPNGFTTGRLVLFRDDIPSQLVPLPIDLCSPSLLATQVRQLFKATLDTTRVEYGKQLELEVLKDANVQNLLSDLIANRGVEVALEFALSRASGGAAGVVGDAVGSITGPVLKQFVPDIAGFPVSADGGLPEITTPWKVDVHATVKNIPHTGDITAPAGQVCNPVTVLLSSIPFNVLALPVPKIAIGFDGKSFGDPAPIDEGAAIMVAPGGVGWPGAVALRVGSTPILGLLQSLQHAVQTIAAAGLPFPNTNGAPDVLKPAIEQLTKYAGSKQIDVYVGQSSEIKSGLDEDFSSFVLLGGPGTAIVLNDPDDEKTSVRMEIPQGTWIADLWTMHESWASVTNAPAPNPAPGKGLGDKVDSFTWA